MQSPIGLPNHVVGYDGQMALCRLNGMPDRGEEIRASRYRLSGVDEGRFGSDHSALPLQGRLQKDAGAVKDKSPTAASGSGTGSVLERKWFRTV